MIEIVIIDPAHLNLKFPSLFLPSFFYFLEVSGLVAGVRWPPGKARIRVAPVGLGNGMLN